MDILAEMARINKNIYDLPIFFKTAKSNNNHI